MYPLRWLLHHYLFFRTPLLRPDRFLEKTPPYAAALASLPALLCYLIAGLMGLYFVTQQFDAFLHTFPRFFNTAGVLAYGLVLAGVKTVHEFSQAYTAKAFGHRVPAMGISFLVLCPIPYCDVTDSWRSVIGGNARASVWPVLERSW